MFIMSLHEEVKKLFLELLGEEFAKVIDTFENPKIYPKDFLDECKYFLEKIIGKEAAEERVEPIYEKYVKVKRERKKTKPSLKGFSWLLGYRKIQTLAKYNLNPKTSLLNCQPHMFPENSYSICQLYT